MNETTSLIEMDLGTRHEMAYQQREEFKMPFNAKLNERSNLYLMPKKNRKRVNRYTLLYFKIIFLNNSIGTGLLNK